MAKLLGKTGLGGMDALGGERHIESGIDDGKNGAELCECHDKGPEDRKRWGNSLAARKPLARHTVRVVVADHIGLVMKFMAGPFEVCR